MLKVHKLKEALRFRAQGLSESAISDRVGIKRSTLHDHLTRALAAGLTYERVKALTPAEVETLMLPPKSNRAKTYQPSWESLFLEGSDAKLSVQQLFEQYKASCPKDFVPLGRTSFYKQYKTYADSVTGDVQRLHWHNSFTEAQVCMIDYSGDGLTYTDYQGKQHKAQIFVGVLGYSGYIFCYATADQTRNSWLLAIAKMFAYFEGVTDEIWLDNSTSLVRKADPVDPVISPEFLNFCEQYGVSPIAVSPGKPTHKGLVENAVQQVQRFILQQLQSGRNFFNLVEINAALTGPLKQLNEKPMSTKPQSRYDRFCQEKKLLKPLPLIPYEPMLKIIDRKVLTGNQVRVENVRYNIPWGNKGKMVRLFIDNNSKKIRMYLRDTGELLTEAELRNSQDGDEPMNSNFLPEELKTIAMGRQQLVEQICSTYGEKAGQVAQAFAKNSNSSARKHLASLFRRLSKLKPDKINDICTQVLEAPVVNFATFRKICDESPKCENLNNKIVSASITVSEQGEKNNVRGREYFKDGGKNDK